MATIHAMGSTWTAMAMMNDEDECLCWCRFDRDVVVLYAECCCFWFDGAATTATV
jgi:hypothetical protein